MTLVLTIIGFLGGVHLAMMLIAACYRVIDLWYRISDFWLSISMRILLLAVINLVPHLLAADLISDDLLTGFMWGQVFFACFHVGIYWLARLGL